MINSRARWTTTARTLSADSWTETASSSQEENIPQLRNITIWTTQGTGGHWASVKLSLSALPLSLSFYSLSLSFSLSPFLCRCLSLLSLSPCLSLSLHSCFRLFKQIKSLIVLFMFKLFRHFSPGFPLRRCQHAVRRHIHDLRRLLFEGNWLGENEPNLA